MNRSVLALVLALGMAASLTACGPEDRRDPNDAGGAVTNGSVSGSQVARRHGGSGSLKDFRADGRYAAGRDGWLDGPGAAGRDMTQDARDMLRDTKEGLKDLGRDIGDVAQDAGRQVERAARDMGRDLTRSHAPSGTPSWEPDSSAQR